MQIYTDTRIGACTGWVVHLQSAPHRQGYGHANGDSRYSCNIVDRGLIQSANKMLIYSKITRGPSA